MHQAFADLRYKKGSKSLLYNEAISEFPPGLYQNEVKCSAFDMEINFHSHANKRMKRTQEKLFADWAQ